MENKPIVTCAGDAVLFSKLHPSLVQALPREPVEWRRSYGRPPRTIYAEATFMTYADTVFPPDDDWTLLARPFFHTFWTDCDIDTYKTKVKDELLAWTSSLKACGATDWLIVHVVQDENKVKTKLLRTSVIDKIKNDFCGKSNEKCTTLHEPFKNDSKSAESWMSLLNRLRTMLLASYNKSLSRFEENMRSQREKRNEPGWNFLHYFILQEELAFMFEMLGLYEDAQVQYDELDALFTQFVLNHAAGATAPWLNSMAKLGCQTWDGLSLKHPLNVEKRKLIQQRRASLLDFRNYLFTRQAHLSFTLCRPWEVAQKTIPYMHNCMQELKMLEVEMPSGALDCWIFLNCLEVLATCERFTDTGHMEAYSLYTASLWNYARQKLLSLGGRCGLMPDLDPTSEQLNLVVDLTSGMTRGQGSESSEPLQKLREALSSKESFQKHYLELSELAMGTFKHIGRIRSARIIGQDLAKFYMKLGEAQKAEGFYMDALKMYQSERWYALVDDTRLKVAECQKVLGDKEKYVSSCALVASSKYLKKEITQKYQEEMVALSSEVKEPVMMAAEPIVTIEDIRCDSPKSILHRETTVTLRIISNLPGSLTCSSILVSVVDATEAVDLLDSSIDSRSSQALPERRRNRSGCSLTSAGSVKYFEEAKPTSVVQERLNLHPSMDIKGEDGMTYVGIVCRKPMHRLDSATLVKNKPLEREDYSECVQATDVILEPGLNTVKLTGKVADMGCYMLQQICLRVGKLDLLHNVAQTELTTFHIVCDRPDIKFCSCSEPLLAGMPQTVILKINTGSQAIPAGTRLALSPSNGLEISGEAIEDNSIKLPETGFYEDLEYPLCVNCKLDQNGTSNYEKRVNVSSGVLKSTEEHLLCFTHPFRLIHKLHTSGKKKFLQLLVHGTTSTNFILSDQELTSDCSDVELVALNKNNQQLTVNQEQSASYMWQLKPNIADTPVLSCMFSVYYVLKEAKNAKPATCSLAFTVENYQTLYSVVTEIVPPEGTVCGAGDTCQLHIKVKAAQDQVNQDQQLMYQLPTDSKDWAICGKTSGVFNVDDSGVFQATLDIMPLNGGYLLHPPVRLLKYQTAENRENVGSPTSGQAPTNMPQLVEFSRGQVYHASAARQVHVHPSNNSSHIDIAVVTNG